MIDLGSIDSRIRQFIVDHCLDDVRTLALKKWGEPDWPRPFILDQIAGFQAMQEKTPAWVANPACLWPAAAIREQASSEATARYKASLVSDVTNYVDLTGGMGVDSWAMACRGARGIVYEKDAMAAAILAHNMALLAPDRIEVRHDDSRHWLEGMDRADLVLIDPARRDASRKGYFTLDRMDPPILKWVPILRSRAQTLLIKLSPMLDLDEAARQLPDLSELIVVEWHGHCREILARIDPAPIAETGLRAVMIDDTGAPIHAWSGPLTARKDPDAACVDPMNVIAEPAPAWQKAGLVDVLGADHHLHRLHPQTHLLTGHDIPARFPGRLFSLEAVIPATRAALKPHIPEGRAMITVRNFPIGVDALRAQLGVAEGGATTLFAVTLRGGEHRLLVCKKL